MRLTADQTHIIRRIVYEEAGDDAIVRLFGSRLDDDARGGDIDLFLQTAHPIDRPAFFSSRIAARLTHALRGRRVDLVLAAPNLRVLPIHELARTGVLL